jgi:hypothetical protein
VFLFGGIAKQFNLSESTRHSRNLIKLSSPFQIGTMHLKNRIVMAPMTTNYAIVEMKRRNPRFGASYWITRSFGQQQIWRE